MQKLSLIKCGCLMCISVCVCVCVNMCVHLSVCQNEQVKHATEIFVSIAIQNNNNNNNNNNKYTHTHVDGHAISTSTDIKQADLKIRSSLKNK